MKAPFGWTVVRRASSKDGFHVYKRDCPADVAHSAADLAPFTHPTKSEARKAGEAGDYAYKQNN